MKKRQVTQYICEFCNKKGLSAAHMVKHEKHCTMNPDRACRMCEYASGVHHDISTLVDMIPEPVIEKIENEFWVQEKVLNIEDIERAIKEIREETDGCVMCLFAAIRQRGLHPNEFMDYKKECITFWGAVNDEKQREHGYY